MSRGIYGIYLITLLVIPCLSGSHYSMTNSEICLLYHDQRIKSSTFLYESPCCMHMYYVAVVLIIFGSVWNSCFVIISLLKFCREIR